MAKKTPEPEQPEAAPQEFLEMLREFQLASQAWQLNLSASSSAPMWDAVSRRVEFAEEWLLNWAKEHA